VATDPLMIDTSAYSAFKRGHAEIVALMRQNRSILVPAVAIGELLAGFERATRRVQNQKELQSFLSRPRVQVTPVTEATAQRYARIYDYLRTAGRPIPTADLWIAASAMEFSAELLTLDAHFLGVPHILVRRVQL